MSPSKSNSCSWGNTNGEPITYAPRRCLTLLFRRLIEAYANAEHVFTWLNTNGHTRTALLMYIVHHNDNLQNSLSREGTMVVWYGVCTIVSDRS